VKARHVAFSRSKLCELKNGYSDWSCRLDEDKLFLELKSVRMELVTMPQFEIEIINSIRIKFDQHGNAVIELVSLSLAESDKRERILCQDPEHAWVISPMNRIPNAVQVEKVRKDQSEWDNKPVETLLIVFDKYKDANKNVEFLLKLSRGYIACDRDYYMNSRKQILANKIVEKNCQDWCTTENPLLLEYNLNQLGDKKICLYKKKYQLTVDEIKLCLEKCQFVIKYSMPEPDIPDVRHEEERCYTWTDRKNGQSWVRDENCFRFAYLGKKGSSLAFPDNSIAERFEKVMHVILKSSATDEALRKLDEIE